MSVIVKGMEMPKVCYECRMYEADIYYCAAAERDIDIPSSDEGRCSFCPLIEVVRCRDCKKHDWCSIEDLALNDETFFCKWGERRE